MRIEIGHPGVVDVELSARLMEALGLTHCVVTDTPEDHPATLREHLGAAAAELLSEIVTPEDVLGLAWARAVSAMAGALRVLAPAPVVQLTGALARPGADDSSIELVREVARVAGGAAYFFYAPMAVPDPTTARGAARAARGGAGVRADRVGHEGGGGGRRVGARAVDAVRRHERGGARGAAAKRGCAPRSPACSSTTTGSP